MKRLLIVIALFASVSLLAGCQANKTDNFDNADSAAFEQAPTQETGDDVGSPPVPPEPTAE